MKLNIGVVKSTADVTKTGTFICTTPNGPNAIVTYVSPFVRDGEGFFAVPYIGTTILYATLDEEDNHGLTESKSYFMGCVSKGISDNLLKDNSTNRALLRDNTPKPPKGFSKNASLKEEIYEFRDVVPEVVSLVTHSGNGLVMRDRSRPEGDKVSVAQDIGTEIKSSTGKSIRLVDSPQIDSILINNGHPSDSVIFCHDQPPGSDATFAAHEFQVHTMGPISLNTTESNMDFIVYSDGRNIELENWSDGMNKESSGTIAHTNSDWGGTFDIADTGNEDYGCIKIFSHNRNVVICTSGVDAVVRVHAPGADSKVIVKTGGSVNIKATRKIIIDSDEEVAINAPTVRITSDSTYVSGTTGVWVN